MSDDLMVPGEAWVNGAKTEEQRLYRIAQLEEARKAGRELAQVIPHPVLDAEEVEVESVFLPREDLVFSLEEVQAAALAPRCIVKDYLYADVAQLAAVGGTGKSTLVLYEAIRIALGLDLYGLEVESPGWTLLVTAEDQRERMAARLWRICDAMELTDEQIKIVLANIGVVDVSGKDVRLVFLEHGNVVQTGLADRIVEQYCDDKPQMVIFDPLISFGASENKVNDNENGIIHACRRIVKGLDCCVRVIHHVSKDVARNGTSDSGIGRGGSALGDGCRMVAGLRTWDGVTDVEQKPSCFLPAKNGQILWLDRVKGSYAPPNQPKIWLQRLGYTFIYGVSQRKRARHMPEEHEDRVLEFMRENPGRWTKTTLREQVDELDLGEKKIAAAVERLIQDGRLVIRPLPKEEVHGARRTYLSFGKVGAK